MAKMTVCTFSFRTHLAYALFEEVTKGLPFGIASVPLFPYKTLDLIEVFFYRTQIRRTWWEEDNLNPDGRTKLPELLLSMKPRIIHY